MKIFGFILIFLVFFSFSSCSTSGDDDNDTLLTLLVLRNLTPVTKWTNTTNLSRYSSENRTKIDVIEAKRTVTFYINNKVEFKIEADIDGDGTNDTIEMARNSARELIKYTGDTESDGEISFFATKDTLPAVSCGKATIEENTLTFLSDETVPNIEFSKGEFFLTFFNGSDDFSFEKVAN